MNIQRVQKKHIICSTTCIREIGDVEKVIRARRLLRERKFKVSNPRQKGQTEWRQNKRLRNEYQCIDLQEILPSKAAITMNTRKKNLSDRTRFLCGPWVTIDVGNAAVAVETWLRRNLITFSPNANKSQNCVFCHLQQQQQQIGNFTSCCT